MTERDVRDLPLGHAFVPLKEGSAGERWPNTCNYEVIKGRKSRRPYLCGAPRDAHAPTAKGLPLGHEFVACNHLDHDTRRCDVWVVDDAAEEPPSQKRCGQTRSAHEAQGTEPTPQLAVIHHMTLMLSAFGRHDPACDCAADQAQHAADCKDCECGLAEAIAFGVEQSGMPLEPEPSPPEEEARLQEIERRAVEKVLAEVKSAPAQPHPATDPEPLLDRVRARWKDGPFHVDPEHGMIGGPAVIGPIGITSFMRGHLKDAETLAEQLNQAWAFGYEAGRDK